MQLIFRVSLSQLATKYVVLVSSGINGGLLYKRLLKMLILLFLPLAGLYPQESSNPLLKSYEQYLRLKESSRYNMEWISLGPVFNSARGEAVQGVPGNPSTFYVAFGSGNLWKTTDNGLSFKPIFENQPVQGIGDIAISRSNPSTIWLGSGESLKKARNFTMPGAGVFKSDDGGETWSHKGLESTWHIGEIALHPENNQIAYVAALGHFWSTNPERGIYMTRDGGDTWDHVLYIDDKTGGNDIVVSPSDPDIIYASMWENNPGISGANSGVYKSSDGGFTWHRLEGGLPSGKGTGRIGLAVSDSDTNIVYALVDNLNRDKNLAAEVYKSSDGGVSWKRTHSDDLLIFPGIGWYFADIYLNPHNDNEVFALGVRMAHSLDGGKTFSNVGGDIYHLNPNQATFLHLDMCELWIDPSVDGRLLLVNDGGIYQSYNNGESWLHHNNIPAGEFYDISVDNQEPYLVYGGVQDDASVYGPSSEWSPQFSDGWDYVWLDAWAGGDGCVTFPDATDPNTVYFSSQNGAARRKNMNEDHSVSIRPRLPEGHKGEQVYAFVAPYFASEHNSNTLYHAGNYIFKSEDKGDSWDLISPDLSESKHKEGSSTTVTAIAESPLIQGLLYAGTDGGLMWTSVDDGETWTAGKTELPPYYIRSIAPSAFSESRVYIAITGLNNDRLDNWLFVSEDRGETWKSISSDLPDEPANVIIEDPVNENILYAGLYRGVYISTDRGESWSLLGDKMPAVAVADLVIQKPTMDLVAGTHGRGIYKLNLDPVHKLFDDENGMAADRIFAIKPAMLPKRNDTHRDVELTSMKKYEITFWLMEGKDVKLELLNESGTIWNHEFHGRKGLNQYRWDLVTGVKDNQLPYFIHYLEFPEPGEYELRITGEGISLSTKMEIIPYREM